MSKVEAFRFSSDGRYFHYARRYASHWSFSSQGGIPEAASNFAKDSTLMQIEMDRCLSAALAIEAFQRHAYKNLADSAVEV